MAATVAVLALVSAACGSAYSEQELAAAHRELLGGGTDAVALDGGVQGDAIPGAARMGTTDVGGDATSGEVSAPGSLTAPDAPARTADGLAGTEERGSSGGPGGTGGAARGEITIATVGNYSGIPGVVYRDAPKAVQAWAQAINEAGGINGRPVRVLVRDDGSDPAKHVAILKELVEEEGVVAFIAHYAPLSGAAGIDYLESKGIPVVGGEPAESWWASPVFFPHTASGEHQFRRQTHSVKQILQQEGRHNVGILVCAEAGSCGAAATQWKRFAPEVGVEIVYDASTSVAQPDYTAECLAMRRANVELVLTSLDGNSIRRLAASCERQSFSPIIWLQGGAAQLQMAADPNLDGLRVTSGVYPYYLAGVPGAALMRDEIGSRIGDVDTFNVVTSAYAGAKLLQRAVEGIEGQVTSASIIESLHGFRNVDLGGLIAPVSYPAGADDSNQALCWFLNSIDGGSFDSPNQGAMECA